jgi:hypothetical protein
MRVLIALPAFPGAVDPRGYQLTPGSKKDSRFAVCPLARLRTRTGLKMAIEWTPNTNHPPRAMLWRFARGIAQRDEARQVVAHLLRRCGACSQIVAAELPVLPERSDFVESSNAAEVSRSGL